MSDLELPLISFVNNSEFLASMVALAADFLLLRCMKHVLISWRSLLIGVMNYLLFLNFHQLIGAFLLEVALQIVQFLVCDVLCGHERSQRCC